MGIKVRSMAFLYAITKKFCDVMPFTSSRHVHNVHLWCGYRLILTYIHVPLLCGSSYIHVQCSIPWEPSNLDS